MTPPLRSRIIEAMIEIVPVPIGDCEKCDPNGGCGSPHYCKETLCLKLIEVIERERGRPL